MKKKNKNNETIYILTKNKKEHIYFNIYNDNFK